MVTITEACAERVAELIIDEKNPNLKLRVAVSGGGCSGFQYGFTFDEDIAEDDNVTEVNGVTFLIDSMSMQYLDNATIDFKGDLSGAGFVIKNPGVTSTCGCGSSFSV